MHINDLGEPTDDTSTEADFRCTCHPPHMGHSFGETLECANCDVAYNEFKVNPVRCPGARHNSSRRGNFHINWNSYKSMWSVTLHGKVVDHVSQGILVNASFKHPRGGKNRPRRPSVHSSQTDWHPDVGACGSYKTMIPVQYHRGSSGWFAHYGENSTYTTAPILEYRAAFLTPEGEVHINPGVSDEDIDNHIWNYQHIKPL
jgi:hypothetical protein